MDTVYTTNTEKIAAWRTDNPDERAWTDAEAMDLWWKTCEDEWAVPEWLPGKFLRAALATRPATTVDAEAVEDMAAALALLLYDAHPTYGSTSGWRGGIGGRAVTQGCNVVDPPPGAEWAQYDLLSEPLRRYMGAHPGFDLTAAKARVKAAALAALGLKVTDEGVGS